MEVLAAGNAIVRAAVFVEGHEQEGVRKVRTGGRRGCPDRVVDLRQVGFAAEQRRGRVDGEPSKERIDRRVHVVVPMYHVRLDERVGGQRPPLGVLVEVVDRGKVRHEVRE